MVAAKNQGFIKYNMLSLGRNPEDLLMVPAEKPTNPGEGYGKSAFGRSLGDVSGMISIFSQLHKDYKDHSCLFWHITLGNDGTFFLEPDIESKICGATKLGIIATGSPKRSMVFAQDINLVLPFWGFTCGIFPTTSKNKVKLCRPSKTMTLLKDTH
jgi:hypothetical protein